MHSFDANLTSKVHQTFEFLILTGNKKSNEIEVFDANLTSKVPDLLELLVCIVHKNSTQSCVFDVIMDPKSTQQINF
jgi:hypothetical protein